MKYFLSLLILSVSLLSQTSEAARGRQPCSGSKGGISHCTSDGSFVCNDGSLSQSKRFCSGYGSQRSLQSQIIDPKRRAITREDKKPSVNRKRTNSCPQCGAKPEEVTAPPEPRKPTCAPIYMASKPGFTNLPICSGNQY